MLNMLPVFAFENIQNHCVGNSISFRSSAACLGASLATGSNFKDFRFSELRPATPLADWMRTSILAFSVSVIVSLSSKKQMIRVYAGRVVALVKNAQPVSGVIIGDWTIRDHPSNLLSIEDDSHSNPEPSITSPISACGPNPATGWAACFVNLFPKSSDLSRIKIDRSYFSADGLLSGLHSYVCNLLAVSGATNAVNRAHFIEINPEVQGAF